MTTPKTKKALNAAPAVAPLLPTYAVAMAPSGYGTMRPTLTITFPAKTSFRVMRAAGLSLAAQVELHSEDAKWIVNVDDGRDTMRISLELSTDQHEEERDGLFTLRAALRSVTGGK